MKKIFSDKDFREAERKKANAGSPHRKILQLMRDGIKLAFSAAGKNTSNFDDKNLKVMSPKLFSVFSEGDNDEGGEEDDPIDVLSPSLLSLHGNGKGLERELSLPNLIKGFTTADQQQWLDLIFEASEVENTIKQAEDALFAQEFQVREKRSYEQRMQSPEGQPLYFTKEKAIETLGNPEAKRIEVSEILIKSYTKNQMKEMNETGYAILSKEQMEIVYGPGSPYADAKKLALFANMTTEQIHQRIEKDIKAMAEKRTIRKKRTILLSPFVNSAVLFAPEVASQPIILSPILFTSVVGSPAVLGPIILGPWLFLPLILSPRLLSPAIINPFLFVPIILSPLALHPAILCPGLFNPIVLSPLALTPFILSPQVFTPIILSPLVLSPFILTPTVGTPVVLSPFVLTPVIYSPLTLFALVLSPNALSPLVESKLHLAEVVLSPSFLS
uniref:Uncharacterized protein n=1 Tax=Panagrolaimus davidi TaxID=227884 RepID=A0A914Q6A3_9BILA